MTQRDICGPIDLQMKESLVARVFRREIAFKEKALSCRQSDTPLRSGVDLAPPLIKALGKEPAT
jgi:hypothetical protein